MILNVHLFKNGETNQESGQNHTHTTHFSHHLFVQAFNFILGGHLFSFAFFVYIFRELLTELSCKSGIYQESGPKGPDF